MLTVGTKMFLAISPRSWQQMLCPGIVRESNRDTVVVEFADPVKFPVGTKVNAYSEVNREFLKQGATITAIRELNGRQIVTFTRIGSVMSAHGRKFIRVQTNDVDVSVQIGQEKDCQVMDVNSQAFAILSKKKYLIGAVLGFTLSYAGQTATGHARIHTGRKHITQYRYGLVVMANDTEALQLLGKIATEVQRMNLRQPHRAA